MIYDNKSYDTWFIYFFVSVVLEKLIGAECIVRINNFSDHVLRTLQVYIDVLNSLTMLNKNELLWLSKKYLTIVYDIEVLMNVFTQGVYGNDYKR